MWEPKQTAGDTFVDKRLPKRNHAGLYDRTKDLGPHVWMLSSVCNCKFLETGMRSFATCFRIKKAR
jgi:hypothetical protein